ncbi:MAG: hypothetical protein ACLPSW_21120 [Roseiarcus sp.]
MLKSLSLIAAISACVFTIALIGLMVGYSWQPPGREPYQHNSAEHEAKKSDSENEKPFWQKATTDPIAAFTLWLVIFTAVLGGAAIFQLASLNRSEVTSAKAANAAKDAADIAKTGLVTVQRAFVFIDSFDANVINNELIIMPKWRNSGTTPTRFMTNYVNWRSFVGEPPIDFTFPDLDRNGIPVTDATRATINTFIGPNATTFADKLVIPTAIMDAIRVGNQRLFIWGWARYRDVFDAWHITRFANEIQFTQLGDPEAAPKPGTRVGVALSFSVYRRNNCTDEECDQQGIP